MVALAAPPASSQPAPAPQNAGWRTAAAAALAFGDAEGKMLALRRHTITAAPATLRMADAALEELNRLASRARDAYLNVERYGSPYWTVAAEVRIGDAFDCQAEKIVLIPMPAFPVTAPPGAAAKAKASYIEVFEGLVYPIRQEALTHWERAAGSSTASAFWSQVARDRLAGKAFPDC
jgi:hypothetical protein